MLIRQQHNFKYSTNGGFDLVTKTTDVVHCYHSVFQVFIYNDYDHNQPKVFGYRVVCLAIVLSVWFNTNL